MSPEKVIERPAIRYHGSKFRLAQWVMGFFPAHRVYVEPFGGGAGVLLQKPRAYAEVYNDLDGQVVNFFRVLRDPATRSQLITALGLTPYARAEFESAFEDDADPIESARRLCIRAQMGFGSSGATKSATGFRVDTDRAYGTAQSLWAEYPDGLAAVGERFQGVLIENRPALDLLDKHDSADTLHFIDPPYLPDTREKGRCYRHEMSEGDHRQLLEALLGLKGYVVLSGYPSELYNQALAGWRTERTTSRIAAGRGAALRTECVWINPACDHALAEQAAQRPLFA